MYCIPRQGNHQHATDLRGGGGRAREGAVVACHESRVLLDTPKQYMDSVTFTNRTQRNWMQVGV